MRWARGKHFPEGRPGRSSPLGAGGMKEWDSVAGLSGHSFPYLFTLHMCWPGSVSGQAGTHKNIQELAGSCADRWLLDDRFLSARAKCKRRPITILTIMNSNL